MSAIHKNKKELCCVSCIVKHFDDLILGLRALNSKCSHDDDITIIKSKSIRNILATCVLTIFAFFNTYHSVSLIIANVTNERAFYATMSVCQVVIIISLTIKSKDRCRLLEMVTFIFKSTNQYSVDCGLRHEEIRFFILKSKVMAIYAILNVLFLISLSIINYSCFLKTDVSDHLSNITSTYIFQSVVFISEITLSIYTRLHRNIKRNAIKHLNGRLKENDFPEYLKIYELSYKIKGITKLLISGSYTTKAIMGFISKTTVFSVATLPVIITFAVVHFCNETFTKKIDGASLLSHFVLLWMFVTNIFIFCILLRTIQNLQYPVSFDFLSRCIIILF